MSAKPQPMAGQSDTADDLIAELAKLMAQDEKTASPALPAAPSFSVRIPGSDTAASPQHGSGHASTSDADQPAMKQPVAPPPGSGADSVPPEPFHFDFDFGLPQQADAAPTPPVSLTPAPEAPAIAADSAADYDSIADLIAAELAGEPPPPATVNVAPAPMSISAAPPPNAAWRPTAVSPALGEHGKSERPTLRPLNLQPVAKSDQDRFNVPPVFGVGTNPAPVEHPSSPLASRPAATAPAEVPVLRQSAPAIATPDAPAMLDDDLGRDPINEIEQLIGRAMRVELEQPAEPVAEPRPAPSPALRSLAGTSDPVVPLTSVSESFAAPRTLSGADAAILAAAEATGAEIGWVEAPEVDSDDDGAPVVRQRQRSAAGVSRAVAGPLVAVTLLLAAGFGLYWVLGLGHEAGPVPLLTADASPIKDTPAEQPESTVPQSIVFNEINGVVPGADEQLVSRDQTDVNEVTQVPPTAALSEEGLANRKVRTVTVRPDGTIVSGEDSVAGSAILPVDRPSVPEVPGAATASPELLASADAAVPTAEPATTTVTATPAGSAAVIPVTPGSIVAAVDLAGNPLIGKTAPVPMLRPAGLVQTTAPTVMAPPVDNPSATGNMLPPPPATSMLGTQPAAQPAVPAAPAAQPTNAGGIPGAVEVDALPNSAPAYAQLASLRTEAEARQAAQNLVTRFGPIFGGANMEVQRVDLGARGIYYRVRVPAPSAQAAGNICVNVIAAGGDCVPM